MKKLEEVACHKIKQYLIVEPRCSTILETKKLLNYFVYCPVSNHNRICFIIFFILKLFLYLIICISDCY